MEGGVEGEEEVRVPLDRKHRTRVSGVFWQRPTWFGKGEVVYRVGEGSG